MRRLGRAEDGEKAGDLGGAENAASAEHDGAPAVQDDDVALPGVEVEGGTGQHTLPIQEDLEAVTGGDGPSGGARDGPSAGEVERAHVTRGDHHQPRANGWVELREHLLELGVVRGPIAGLVEEDDGCASMLGEGAGPASGRLQREVDRRRLGE